MARREFSGQRMRDIQSTIGSDPANAEQHRHSLDSHVEARFVRFIGLSGLLQRISERTGVHRNEIISGGASTHQDVCATLPEHAAHVIQAQLRPNMESRLGSQFYNQLRSEIEHTQPTPAVYNVGRFGKALDNVQRDLINNGTLNSINFKEEIDNLQNLQIIKDVKERFINGLRNSRQREEEKPGSNYPNSLDCFDTAIHTLENLDVSSVYSRGRQKYLGPEYSAALEAAIAHNNNVHKKELFKIRSSLPEYNQENSQSDFTLEENVYQQGLLLSRIRLSLPEFNLENTQPDFIVKDNQNASNSNPIKKK